MSISFSCSQCGNDYVVSDGLAGKSAICKACGARMTVPGSAAAEAPAEVEAVDEPAAEVAAGPAPVAPPKAAFASPTFATAKPASGGGGRRVVWLVVVIGAAVFGGLRGMGVSSKTEVRAFFQGLVEVDQKILTTLKGVKDVDSAKAASGPLNEQFQRKIDHFEKNRKKKGRTKDIEAVSAEYKPQIDATQAEIAKEVFRVMIIPGAWDALAITEQIERLEKLDQEVSKESAKK